MDINDLVGGGKVVPIPALIKTIVSDVQKKEEKGERKPLFYPPSQLQINELKAQRRSLYLPLSLSLPSSLTTSE